MEWKYGERLSKENISDVEEEFGVELPKKCVSIFSEHNKGKPTESHFDIRSREGCIVDYLVDLSEAKKIAGRIGETHFIPLATDPFGNYIGYKIDRMGNISKIVFWDHENGEEIFVSDSLKDFISMLY